MSRQFHISIHHMVVAEPGVDSSHGPQVIHKPKRLVIGNLTGLAQTAKCLNDFKISDLSLREREREREREKKRENKVSFTM